MATTYTFDVSSTLDGFGAHQGDWGGYWGKQGPELLAHRLAIYSEPQRMVFGANTYKAHSQMLAAGECADDQVTLDDPDIVIQGQGVVHLRYPVGNGSALKTRRGPALSEAVVDLEES